MLAAAALVAPSHAQTPISLFRNFVGHIDYRATGNSLRSAPNTVNACTLNASSSAVIGGIPAGAGIRAAYLYWAGSGSTPDTTVSFNGSSVSADRSFTDTFVFNGSNFDFFSGFADVTTRVAGNGTYTFAGLSVNNGAHYCSSQAVVSGWSLVVVYEHAGEDLRAVNVFDGFELFRQDALTLTVDTYRIPPTGIDGRLTAISWEGDPQNSGSAGGFSESLLFNGNLLDDGLIPPASSPAVQQFDGTVNTSGSMSSHGVDVDSYDVSAFLSPGDTSATMTFSSGADLVLLSAEIISFTTDPVVDLQISLSHAGDFSVGSTGDYAITVANNGPETEANPITVTNTLPEGLTLSGAAGAGWACTLAGSDVSCVHAGPLPAAASLPALTLSVAVTGAAAPAVINRARVDSASVDLDPGNNAATDPTTVLASDLSLSTKSVADLDGGDAEPGDTLRYTIALQETAGIAATGVSLSDDIPAFIDSYFITALPPGAIDASTGTGTGANGNGRIAITNIAVPAGGNTVVVIEAIIASTASPGDIIANQAVISNPEGLGGAPAAPDVIVSESAVSRGGTKTLYLFDATTADPNGFAEGAPPWLSRTPPATPQDVVTVSNFGAPVTWTMTPALRAPLRIDAGTIPVTLFVARDGGGPFFGQRRLQVALSLSGTAAGPLGTPVTQQFSAPPLGGATALTFSVPLAAATTLPAGARIHLTLTNTTPGFGFPRTAIVVPIYGGEHSRIDLPALTVISVESTVTFDAPAPGGTAVSGFAPGAGVSLRADVSDPFGTFDISRVEIDVFDQQGTPVVTAQPMQLSATIDGATARYEYLLDLPSPASGSWRYRVTAHEGTEGLISHRRTGTFFIATPQLTLSKSVSVLNDPVNGSANPKAVPGAIMLYTLTLANSGAAGVDADSLSIADTLPPQTSMYVDTAGGDPVVFIDGSPSSGLAWDFTTAVSFSNQPGGGAPYDYSPVPDAQGFDPQVTGFAVAPAGAMPGLAAGGSPAFTLRYRTRVE